jgi:hypothetical protein
LRTAGAAQAYRKIEIQNSLETDRMSSAEAAYLSSLQDLKKLVNKALIPVVPRIGSEFNLAQINE